MKKAKVATNGLSLRQRIRKALNLNGSRRLETEAAHALDVWRSQGPATAEQLAGSLHQYCKVATSESNVRKEVQKEVARAAAEEG